MIALFFQKKKIIFKKPDIVMRNKHLMFYDKVKLLEIYTFYKNKFLENPSYF